MRGKYVKCPACQEPFFARPPTVAVDLPPELTNPPGPAGPALFAESAGVLPLPPEAQNPRFLAVAALAPLFLVVVWGWRVPPVQAFVILLFGGAMCLVAALAAYQLPWPVPLRALCVLALDIFLFVGPFLVPWGPFVIRREVGAEIPGHHERGQMVPGPARHVWLAGSPADLVQ
jgi:hypothetical protein